MRDYAQLITDLEESIQLCDKLIVDVAEMQRWAETLEQRMAQRQIEEAVADDQAIDTPEQFTAQPGDAAPDPGEYASLYQPEVWRAPEQEWFADVYPPGVSPSNGADP